MRQHILNRACVYRASVCLARILPLWLMRRIAKLGGLVSYIFCQKARNNVGDNLSYVLHNPVRIKRVTRQVFLNYGIYLADWAKFIAMDTKTVFSRFTSIQGEPILKEALQRGKGIILLTAHLGNWELGGVFFSHSKIPINIITAKDEIRAIADIRETIRGYHNVKTMTVGGNSFSFIDIINALKRNEVVAMLIDRYDRENGVLIDFFGEPAYFPPGPVLLARGTGAAVIPAFTVMGPDGNYKAVTDSMIDMEFSDDKKTDVRVNLNKIVKVFERYISEYASQWYNFSSIWRKSK